MNTKTFRHFLVILAISIGMVSCVDNIDNSTTPSDKEQQEDNDEDDF